MKMNFSKQITIGLVIALLGIIISSITENRFFTNIGFAIYGLLFLINPVAPEYAKGYAHIEKYIRIVGAVIFILGAITHFNT